MQQTSYRIALITLSDRAAAGSRADESGRVLRELLEQHGLPVFAQFVLPDDAGQLVDRLIRLADVEHADLILTTGGTGLGRRDVTPDATLAVIDQRVPGIEEAMRLAGLRQTPFAMLSRAVAGVRGRTLIINLPGSPAAVRENLAVVLPVLPHALTLLHDGQVQDEQHFFKP
ncbi:MAG: MogA/MoaB family molybdenum cofactor biosynthesis protein [candidate division KSB1 bacterium]|nr:MogA/MoaB family molybdenum cofactor biosynthesis protein [candidate division KSB1 bacterium]MDZ7274589.1 MogA/MoaB family molybdenum cofactor biosynthesis protein [candidate division KSB1 bacterium]MDZ7284750.1 MogA/MoaB family molybdenum cofactor biosynthesis protein [candidate division KSB1 bacterium]MDZ7297830.1 MogA/MoaB family molybdenum cofactor biosynthesis protein [candidate division KSB1 bacterium]MDZ7308871.1 MogA/MoaB family molybdenum cofactor biosynthesis protein [candidate div